MGCGGRGSVGRVRCVRRAVFRERAQRAGRMTLLRTAKPCGPDTRCWCQVVRRRSQPDRVRSAANSPTTVTRRIRRRGEHGISRKPIAQGMPECSDCTCMLVCVFCALFAHETAGAACTRHSLLPLLGEKVLKNFGRIAPRECEVTFGCHPREGGGSSIPETPVIESISRGVLDTPHARGTTIQGDVPAFRNDGAMWREFTFGGRQTPHPGDQAPPRESDAAWRS